jgi:hypothetical protein
VGWMLARRESEHLAERLIRETVVKPIFDTAFPYPIDGEAIASTGDVVGTTRTLPCGG